MKMKTICDIRKGDIIFYRNGGINYVNKPYNYKLWYNKKYSNKGLGSSYDIMEIKRFTPFIFGYRLKTVYKREDSINETRTRSIK